MVLAVLPLVSIFPLPVTILGSLLLSGCVKRFLQKGNFSLDVLLREIRDLMVKVE
jgi:hypothetical protein